MKNICKDENICVVISEVWGKGSDGGIELAKEVLKQIEISDKSKFSYAYELNDTIEKKLNDIATKIYHADSVIFTDNAKKQMEVLEKLGFDKLPICVAKTQYSFSDDQKLLGAPSGFKITVRELKVSAGAGFIVALTGNIMTMPGLPKVPAAEKIDLDSNGNIVGLF